MSTDLNIIGLYVNLRREENVELQKQFVKRNPSRGLNYKEILFLQANTKVTLWKYIYIYMQASAIRYDSPEFGFD